MKNWVAFLLIAIGTGCGKKQEPRYQYTLIVARDSNTIARCTGGEIPQSAPTLEIQGPKTDHPLWIASIPPKPHVDHCELVAPHTVDDLMNFILEHEAVRQ